MTPGPLDLIRWVLHQPHLSPAARLVAITIAHRHSPSGAWPSTSTIAAEAGISRRTVFRALDELEAAGLLARRSRDGGKLAQPATIAPNRYFLLAPGISPPPAC